MSPELPSSSGMASKGTSVTRGGARLLIRVDCTGVGRLPAVLASLPALLLPACRFTLAPSSCTMPEMMSCTSGSDFRHERVPPPATSAAPWNFALGLRLLRLLTSASLTLHGVFEPELDPSAGKRTADERSRFHLDRLEVRAGWMMDRATSRTQQTASTAGGLIFRRRLPVFFSV